MSSAGLQIASEDELREGHGRKRRLGKGEDGLRELRTKGSPGKELFAVVSVTAFAWESIGLL